VRIPPRSLALTSELQHLSQGTAALFSARVLEEQLKEIRFGGWATSVRSLDELGEPAWRVVTEGHESALFLQAEATVEVDLYSSHVSVAVAAREARAAEEAYARLQELFPAPDLSSKHEVQVTFWTYGPHGPQPAWRSIAVPGWDEIDANYSAATRAELQRLMRGFQPAHGGQLILWHGQAGTGKTFGLRALAWEWREWCEFHYIVDPDSFFGEHADYLISVLLQPGYEAMPMNPGVLRMMHMTGGAVGYDMAIADDEDEDGAGSRKAWRVLLLEDTGELLAADARASMGQGLSRFLNVVDGLIGQGLRVLVLVTTNEEIRALHPAVARPGRCAANIEFSPLTGDEAAAWLGRHGLEVDGAQPATLAALYARLARSHGDEAAIEAGFLPAER
jgi:uncharacterized protein DUF5925